MYAEGLYLHIDAKFWTSCIKNMTFNIILKNFFCLQTLCLMELPQSLASIPPGIVDVFVCNLLPIDEDIAWGNQITRIVQDQLKNRQNPEKCYFMGKVLLHRFVDLYFLYIVR